MKRLALLAIALIAACGNDGPEPQQRQLTVSETQQACADAISDLRANPADIECPDVVYAAPVRCGRSDINCCNPDAINDPEIRREAGAAYNQKTNVIYATLNFGAPCNTVERQVTTEMCAAVRCQARGVCPQADDEHGVFAEYFDTECGD